VVRQHQDWRRSRIIPVGKTQIGESSNGGCHEAAAADERCWVTLFFVPRPVERIAIGFAGGAARME
jgi:hypothetical protein